MRMQPEELKLKDGERMVSSAKISRASLVVLWLSVPCFVIVSFGGLLPGIIRLIHLASFISDTIAAVLGGLLAAAMSVLTLAWIVVAAFLTKRHGRFGLIYTNLRLVATSNNTQLEADIADLKNVFVEVSLLGKIFGYGSLTVQTEKGSVTVKNVYDPEQLKTELFDLMKVRS